MINDSKADKNNIQHIPLLNASVSSSNNLSG